MKNEEHTKPLLADEEPNKEDGSENVTESVKTAGSSVYMVGAKSVEAAYDGLQKVKPYLQEAYSKCCSAATAAWSEARKKVSGNAEVPLAAKTDTSDEVDSDYKKMAM